MVVGSLWWIRAEVVVGEAFSLVNSLKGQTPHALGQETWYRMNVTYDETPIRRGLTTRDTSTPMEAAASQSYDD